MHTCHSASHMGNFLQLLFYVVVNFDWVILGRCYFSLGFSRSAGPFGIGICRHSIVLFMGMERS